MHVEIHQESTLQSLFNASYIEHDSDYMFVPLGRITHSFTTGVDGTPMLRMEKIPFSVSGLDDLITFDDQVQYYAKGIFGTRDKQLQEAITRQL